MSALKPQISIEEAKRISLQTRWFPLREQSEKTYDDVSDWFAAMRTALYAGSCGFCERWRVEFKEKPSCRKCELEDVCNWDVCYVTYWDLRKILESECYDPEKICGLIDKMIRAIEHAKETE